jgi:hypothetical protein
MVAGEKMTLDVLIFSKDRAAQLDLTLSSMKNHFVDWRDYRFHVLFTYSNEMHKLSYDRVMSLHPEFKWTKETHFRNDTIRIFNSFVGPYVSFLVDDDVFIDNMSLDCPEFKRFSSDPSIAVLSPRIAPYVNYCYTARIGTPPPAIFNGSPWVWNWKDSALQGDWNYPMSIASLHIFRKEDLIQPINNVLFRAPNSFEGNCLAPNPPHHRPNMICFDRCKVICGTNNRVQTENANYHENSHTPDGLCHGFLSGKRLNPTINDGIIVPMCHGPVKLEFA